jgi:PAS domain S-box-containing protein
MTREMEEDARLERLFRDSAEGMFVARLDEPIAWGPDADREALLDYTFEHLRTTATNETQCRQFGAPREVMIGSTPRQRWRHGDPQEWRRCMHVLFDNGFARHEIRAPRASGDFLDIVGEYVVFYDDERRITGYFGLQRSRTEEKQTMERLELALQSGGIGVWEFDIPGQRLHYDPNWLAYLGYGDCIEESKDPTWWEARRNPGDYEELTRAFYEHISGKSASYRAEHRVKTADGRWIWLLSTGRITARDAAGSPTRFVGTSVDVTERKALQERVAFAERMASIGTLAAGVAHEINNPLTYVLLNLALLERNVSAVSAKVGPEMAAKLRNMVEQARYGCDRVSTVVRDLQVLTRVSDQGEVHVDVNQVLERCFEIASHQLRFRARLVRDLTPVPPIRASEHRIGQLFLNLIVNAAQAIPEGAAESNEIRVTTSVHRDGRVCIEVSDTGTGISPEVIGRIFDPFFTTKPVGEGSGIGLSICRSIVASLGGEIAVETNKGRGTLFRVLLPPGTEQVVRTIMPPMPRELASRLRILVIDDEPLIGPVITSLLGGHHVVTEVSAPKALQRLQRGETYDWILCDLMMPEMTGMDLYEALEADVQDRVIFISGGAFTDRARDFLQRVPNRRLFKPFDVETLVAALS